MYDLRDWICLHHALRDSCLEANRAVRVKTHPRQTVAAIHEDMRESAVRSNISHHGTFITLPAYWLGKYE